MVKKCVYCRQELKDERAVDVCDKCGVGVWGEKMFKAIIKNMENARATGNLFQGTVNEDLQKNLKDNNFSSLKIK